jgi:GntR family transcriptional regulator
MELKIDHNSPVPLHAQVEELIRMLIGLKEYQEGALLPKEIDLSKRLGISRNTLRQATNKLVNEGLLVRKKGVGTTVARQNLITTRLENWHSFTQEMNEKGISLKNFELHIEKVIPNEKILKFLNTNANDLVLKVSRTRGSDKGPFLYTESTFHPRIGLTGAEDYTRPLYDILENDYNTIPVKSEEVISASIANDQIAKHLQIKSGFPVLVRERFVYDPGDRPVEYNIVFYRADKFSYSIIVKR